MAEDDFDTLVKLGDTDQTVSMADEDVRGRVVKDRDGEELGHVEDLLVDPADNKVRFLVIASGGFLGIGEHKSFVPVDAVDRITDDEVRIVQSRNLVAEAPGYDPDLADRRSYYEDVYAYYGYTPFWGTGYIYPGYPYYP